MAISQYCVLNALAGGAEELPDLQDHMRRIGLFAFPLCAPASHPEFYEAINEPSVLQSRELAFFSPFDPPPRWLEDNVKDCHLRWESEYLHILLSPSNALTSKDPTITALSLATSLDIPYDHLPYLIVTHDLTSRYVMKIRTHSSSVRRQLEYLDRLAARRSGYSFSSSLAEARRVNLDAADPEAFLEKNVGAMILHQTNLVVASDEDHPDHESALIYVRNNLLPELNADFARFKDRIATLRRYVSTRHRDHTLESMVDVFLWDLEKTCEKLVVAAAHLRSIEPLDLMDFISIDPQFLQEESRAKLRSINGAFNYFKANRDSDFYPVVIAISHVFEREVNLSVVHFIRKMLGIAIPDYFDKFRPKNRGKTAVKLGGTDFNDRPENYNRTPRVLNEWVAPSIGEIEYICNKIDDSVSKEKGFGPFENLELVEMWQRLKADVTSWGLLMQNWRLITKIRNNAAHDNSRLGGQDEVEAVRLALNKLANAGVFRQLSHVKNRLRGKMRFSEIARLAGLRYCGPDVKIVHSKEKKRHLMETLWLAALCHKEDAKGYDFSSDRDLKNPQYSRVVSIVDVLGEYLPDTKTIVIYDELCLVSAKVLRVDVEILKQVVEVHEIVHAVTHIGEDERGGRWSYFDLASTEDKELFAQAYSMKYYESTDDNLHLEVFENLSKHQDCRYNLWRKWKGRSTESLNEELRKARTKLPEVPSLQVKCSVNGDEVEIDDRKILLNMRGKQIEIGEMESDDLLKLHRLVRRVDGRPTHRSRPQNHDRFAITLGGRNIFWDRGDGEDGDDILLQRIKDTVFVMKTRVVVFRDEHLRRKLRQLRIAEAELVTREKVLELRDLNLCNCQIRYLEGLESAKQLFRLNLYGNGIEDISPLAGLAKLKSLDLDSNTIRDISPLAGLSELASLRLGSNRIEDISPLAGLAKLKSLDLDSNTIRDISPLAGLSELASLRLGSNRIEDISPLAGLPTLRVLFLGNNSVIDVLPLAELSELTHLDLRNNEIFNFSPLERLEKLEELNKDDNHSFEKIVESLTSVPGRGNRVRGLLSFGEKLYEIGAYQEAQQICSQAEIVANQIPEGNPWRETYLSLVKEHQSRWSLQSLPKQHR